jgi:RecB family exonuclease
MLEFIKIKHPDQIKDLMSEFNPEKQTWIVSDLRSKQEIQNECLKRFGYFTDDSILRVSDFWKIWIRRLKPNLQVVASDFIKSLVSVFIDQHGVEIEISENEASTLERYVQELAPLILHPESDSVLKEWLAAHEEPKKWQKWYLIARVCIQFILNEKKVIDTKWSAAFLQSFQAEQLEWPKEIKVDLGTELTSIEMGLFKIFSQKQKVQVYVPFPVWQERFPFLLKTYIENFGYGQVIENKMPSALKKNEKFFLRLSTQLAEIKFAVAQVRKWLDQGVSHEKIALVAVQIEEYWPTLESFLSEEGVAYEKDVVTRLNSLSDIQIFLAHLKSYTNDVNFESLQQKLYQNQNKPQLKFEKFKSLFSQIYDAENLKRDHKIQDLFYRKIDLAASLSRDEFIAILVQVWTDLPESAYSAQLFETIFKDLLSQSLESNMKFLRWFQFLKSRFSHKEVKVKKAQPGGIQILSLMSAQMTLADHRVYLGLTENAFKVQKKSMLPLKDIESLKKEFDLAIQYPEESHLDFNLRWQAETDCAAFILTTPHLSFNAEPMTPNLYFLENNPKSEIFNPGLTRHDEIQKNLSFNEGQTLLNDQKLSSLKRLHEDLSSATLSVKNNIFKQLAASEVENYAQCSFKLLASKGFRLRELPEVSIDLDPRQKGTLVHALFEFLIKAFQVGPVSRADILQFLESQRTEFNLFANEDSFWNVQKNKLLVLSDKFYEFEKERILKFNSLTEVSFEIWIDPIKKKVLSEKSENSISIKGRIDRLDQEKKMNYFLIYDYKSSGAQAKGYSKWLTEYQFQLMFYILAVENVLFKEADVKGSLYYLYKNFDVSKGLIDKELALSEFHFSKLNKSLIEPENTLELKEKFIQFISECFLRLEQGEFKAIPFDIKICQDCDWSKLCRAQHLM